MKRYALTVRGSRKTWSFTLNADLAHVEDWRADGLEVDELVYSIPAWVVDLGGTWLWCRCSDVFNFRWVRKP